MRGLLSLLCFLSLTIPVSAQQETWRAYEFFNLTGGLNDTSDPTAIAVNEASDLQNVVFSTSGGIEKRGGFDNINTATAGASETAPGIGFFRQPDGTRYLVKTSSNGATDKFFKMDYAGSAGPDGTWDDITGSLSLSFADNELADFATAESILYTAYGNGDDSLLKWTGSGNATELTTLPDATMVEFHKRILWLAGRSDARSRVDFSNLDEPETFTSTDFILVETDDNQIISGLRSALDCLYVFKTESIWRICGADRDNLTLEQMVRGIGAASNQSIAIINNQFVFLTAQGDVAVYDGGITVKILSSKIEGTLTNLNYARFEKAAAVAFDDGTGDEDYYICLSSSGSGTHDVLLAYDTFHQAWTKFSGITCNSLAVYEVGSAQRAIVFSDYAGFIHRYPTGNNDNGAAIEAYYQSGHLRFDVPFQKDFHHIQVILRQQGNYSLTFEHRLDFVGAGTQDTLSLSGSSAVWDTAIWDSAVYADIATLIRIVSVDQIGDFLQWRIEDNAVDEPFLLRGLRIWLEPTGRVGGT